MDVLRRKIKRIMYSLGAVIVLLILLRFVLRLLGVSETVPVINLIYQISFPLIAPFQGIIVDSVRGTFGIEFTDIVALVAWIGIIIVLTELVTSFIYDSMGEIFTNLVDVIFKFIEFFLLVRLLMRAFGVQSGANELIDVIYNIASIVYTPFAGIAPGISIGQGVIEISTLIALIIVVLFDVVSDGVLRSLFHVEKKEPKDNGQTTTTVSVTTPQPVLPPVTQPQQPQNINIFIPAGTQQPSPVIVQQHPSIPAEEVNSAQRLRSYRAE